ncbi:MAG: nucleoside deaminase [Nanoarchaeota archaeon]
MSDFMLLAAKEAEQGVRLGHGGPFGAVIVRKGRIIAKGHNRVIVTNDPSAHAEIVAIRAATKKLGRFDLSDCELYTSCEPCPMCLAAIHWAKMRTLFYGATRKDAARIGFDDNIIYDLIKGKAKKTQVTKKQISRELCLKPMREWEKKDDKTRY